MLKAAFSKKKSENDLIEAQQLDQVQDDSLDDSSKDWGGDWSESAQGSDHNEEVVIDDPKADSLVSGSLTRDPSEGANLQNPFRKSTGMIRGLSLRDLGDVDNLDEDDPKNPHEWRSDFENKNKSFGSYNDGDEPTRDVRRAKSTSAIEKSKSDDDQSTNDSDTETDASSISDSDIDSDIDAVVSSSFDSKEGKKKKGSDIDSDIDAVASSSFESKEGKKKKKKKKRKSKKKKKKMRGSVDHSKRSSRSSTLSSRYSRGDDSASLSRSLSRSDKKKKKRKSKDEVMDSNEEAKNAAKVLDKEIAIQMANNDAHKEKIVTLQQQLSEALHKVVATTEEQIQDKDQFLKLSTELTQLKAQLAEITKTCDNAEEQVRARNLTVEEKETHIEKLEAVVERQLDLQDAIELKLEHSEDEIEKLLREIEELETGNVDVGKSTRALQAELDGLTEKLDGKEKDIEEYMEKVEVLEKELEEADNVNKLQIIEMEQENTALLGKLRGERLDTTSKLSKKDDVIFRLEKELQKFKNDDEVNDVMAARDKVEATKLEMEEMKNERDEVMNKVAGLNGEKEDLIEKINVLNNQIKLLTKENKDLTTKNERANELVLERTEQTYNWKGRAEVAEQNLRDLDPELATTDDKAAPQGMHLQAVMDAQEEQRRKQPKNSVFSYFGSTLFRGDEISDEEDSAEQIRIKALEERNESLESTVAQLRSEIIKIEAAHKEKLDSMQKQSDPIEGENGTPEVKKLVQQYESGKKV